MTMVAIVAERAESGVSYRAVSGDRQTLGKTAGEALDALTAQLPEDRIGTLVIIQNLRPDQYFTAKQQERLQELMMRWRTARDDGQMLSPGEQAELDALVDAEVRATGERARALLNELAR